MKKTQVSIIKNGGLECVMTIELRENNDSLVLVF
jgi:hypothetical protein